MKKIILMLVLLGISNVAMAGWVKIGHVDAGALYVDSRDTGQSTPNGWIVWEAIDYKKVQYVQGLPYHTLVFQEEYNCATRLDRARGFTMYSGHMMYSGRGAKGENVYSDPNGGTWSGWIPLPPGSIAYLILKGLCNK